MIVLGGIRIGGVCDGGRSDGGDSGGDVDDADDDDDDDGDGDSHNGKKYPKSSPYCLHVFWQRNQRRLRWKGVGVSAVHESFKQSISGSLSERGHGVRA